MREGMGWWGVGRGGSIEVFGRGKSLDYLIWVGEMGGCINGLRLEREFLIREKILSS
jgi:hypothetical protein